MYTALTIAGSDSSGGAGIQADLKTMAAHHVYGMSAITALTAQNTTGVTDILEVPPAFLAAQLDSIFTDIPPQAVKVGMVSSGALIQVIGDKLRQYGTGNIVVDPVMVATSGARLISEEAVEVLCRELLSLAAVLTPNIPEAEVLSGLTIPDAAAMEQAAGAIGARYGCAVLLKGGHRVSDADDYLWQPSGGRWFHGVRIDNPGVFRDSGGIGGRWFHGVRIDNPNTHGTGCTLSSAIASNLARGYSLERAVEEAKAYLSGALGAMLDLGKGSGPMDHAFAVAGTYPAGH